MKRCWPATKQALGLTADSGAPFAARHAAAISALSLKLASMLDVGPSTEADELLRLARRKLRDKAGRDGDADKALKQTAAALARVGRIGAFAFATRASRRNSLPSI